MRCQWVNTLCVPSLFRYEARVGGVWSDGEDLHMF